MKRADILKFKSENKYVFYPINTIKGGGGIASSPYIVGVNLIDREIAEKLLQSLNFSEVEVSYPDDWSSSKKEHLKAIGVKNMKALHEESLNLSISTKDGNYNISPTVNKGSRQGFHYTKERIIIPLSSSKEELAEAIKEAFDKCS